MYEELNSFLPSCLEEGAEQVQAQGQHPGKHGHGGVKTKVSEKLTRDSAGHGPQGPAGGVGGHQEQEKHQARDEVTHNNLTFCLKTEKNILPTFPWMLRSCLGKRP